MKAKNPKNCGLSNMQRSEGIAELFYKNNGCTLKQISDVLAIGESTLSESWLKDDIQEYKEEQKKTIVDLYLQCLTQEEIANRLELTQGRIAQIINKFKTEEINKIGLVPESLQYFNVWNFKDRDKKHGLAYEGAIPGQIVENVLHYFTEPFDIVVDPMAGGGTTIDVCRTMYRRWRAYDITPLLPEITKHDIREGFPNETKNCDLIFLDPPYFNMVFKDLFKDVQNFYEFLRSIASSAFKTVKTSGIVTLLMQDMTELGNYLSMHRSALT
jgi:transcriptional regulator with XRE-family HTH domain